MFPTASVLDLVSFEVVTMFCVHIHYEMSSCACIFDARVFVYSVRSLICFTENNERFEKYFPKIDQLHCLPIVVEKKRVSSRLIFSGDI